MTALPHSPSYKSQITNHKSRHLGDGILLVAKQEEQIMKAFVTGGTGFLGRHLVELLVEAGWQVTALHRKTSDISHLQKPEVKLVAGDVTDI